jgi:hypothetical protein
METELLPGERDPYRGFLAKWHGLGVFIYLLLGVAQSL